MPSNLLRAEEVIIPMSDRERALWGRNTELERENSVLRELLANAHKDIEQLQAKPQAQPRREPQVKRQGRKYTDEFVQEVIRLRDVEHLTWQAIDDGLGLPYNSGRSLYTRAKK